MLGASVDAEAGVEGDRRRRRRRRRPAARCGRRCRPGRRSRRGRCRAARPVAGAVPTPTTTRRRRACCRRRGPAPPPGPRRGRSPASRRSAPAPPRSRCSSANQPPSCSPRIGASGVASASIIVTSTPEPAGRRGDLLADEAGADDRQPSARDELGPQAARVREGAQGVDVLVAVEERQPPRRAAGRDQQLARSRAPRRSRARSRPRRRVERLGAGAEQQLDPLLLVPARPAGRRPTPRRRVPASSSLESGGRS